MEIADRSGFGFTEKANSQPIQVVGHLSVDQIANGTLPDLPKSTLFQGVQAVSLSLGSSSGSVTGSISGSSRTFRLSSLLEFFSVERRKAERRNHAERRNLATNLNREFIREAPLQDRMSCFRRDDFLEASVLDLSPQLNPAGFQFSDWGASHVTGVEYEHAAYLQAVRIRRTVDRDSGKRVRFLFDDLHNPFFWRMLRSVDVIVVDLKLCREDLSLISSLIARAAQKTDRVLYLTGIPIRKIAPQTCLSHLLDWTDFTRIEFIGEYQESGETFAMLRCQRETMTSSECAQHLLASTANKIAVIGRGCAGKSYIRRLISGSPKLGDRKIVDDLRLENSSAQSERISIRALNHLKRAIVFDYRALEYSHDFDAVYFVSPSTDYLDAKHYPDAPDFRSPQGNLSQVKAFYSVCSR